MLAHDLGTYRVGRIAALLEKVDTNIAADATLASHSAMVVRQISLL